MSDDLDRRDIDTMKMVLNSLRPCGTGDEHYPSVAAIDRRFSCHSRSSCGSFWFEQPDWRLHRRGVFKREMWNRQELPQALTLAEHHCTGLDQLPVQSERVVEPPSLDHALKWHTIRFPAVARSLQIKIPARRCAKKPRRRERDNASAKLALDCRFKLRRNFDSKTFKPGPSIPCGNNIGWAKHLPAPLVSHDERKTLVSVRQLVHPMPSRRRRSQLPSFTPTIRNQAKCLELHRRQKLRFGSRSGPDSRQLVLMLLSQARQFATRETDIAGMELSVARDLERRARGCRSRFQLAYSIAWLADPRCCPPDSVTLQLRNRWCIEPDRRFCL